MRASILWPLCFAIPFAMLCLVWEAAKYLELWQFLGLILSAIAAAGLWFDRRCEHERRSQRR